MKHLLRKRSFALYLLACLVLLLPAGVVLALNYWILYQSGERQSPRDIAAALQSDQEIFASGLQDLRREVNLEAHSLRAPGIVAFGSSRAFNFRQEFFSSPFSCACGAAPNLVEGKIYAEDLLDLHTPKVVILSLDFWWFTTKSGVHPRPLITDSPPLTLQKLLKPMALVMDGTITAGQYWSLLKPGNDFTATTTYKKEGLLAIARGMGGRGDGSFFGGVSLSDHAEEYYRQWAENLHNAEAFIQTNDRYGPNQTILEENIAQYAALVKTFQDRGIKVVSVILPFAPPIYEALAQSPDHAYFFELPERISGYSDEFYDFSNPVLVDAGICEFEDAHHSGDTVMMRVLREIVRRRPNSAISPYFDREKLDRYIAAFAGHTTAMFNKDMYLSKERDFLGFGCKK